MSGDSKDHYDSDHGMDLLSLKRNAFWHLWKRRGLLLVALIFVLFPLWGTFAPLFEFILFAISLAALTYPVFYRPIYRLVQKVGSNLPSHRLSEFSAILSTLTLVLFMLSPILLLLVEASKSPQSFGNMVVSLALGEDEGRKILLNSVGQRISEMRSIYPRLPIDEEKAVQFVANLLGDTRQFSGSFLEFLFKGTRGFVAELALALIALSFLYAHGGSFVQQAMKFGGFEKKEVETWFKLHQKITLRLLSDTLLTSIFRGLSLGLVGYFVGGFFFLPVFFLGSFAGLVPVVGSAMIWLPLASLVWSRGEPVTALLLASLSLLLNYGISRFRAGMGKRLHEQGAWLSFMLFLGIIGGLLSYGPQGFVIGPMAVVLAYGLIRFLSGQSVTNS
ncbi:MAG: AI-2E family transporter [Verrucomicrobiota bacterium]|nr:AI-2E family transporter [Verrucomicrobiota bacterium]